MVVRVTPDTAHWIVDCAKRIHGERSNIKSLLRTVSSFCIMRLIDGFWEGSDDTGIIRLLSMLKATKVYCVIALLSKTGWHALKEIQVLDYQLARSVEKLFLKNVSKERSTKASSIASKFRKTARLCSFHRVVGIRHAYFVCIKWSCVLEARTK